MSAPQADFKPAWFPVLVNPWHDLLTAGSRGVSGLSQTPTGPPKHPHALPKRDSRIHGTIRRAQRSEGPRRSRSPERG
jgi:hypothetical protein